MEVSCSKKECLAPPTLACNCTGNHTLFCDTHIRDHFNESSRKHPVIKLKNLLFKKDKPAYLENLKTIVKNEKSLRLQIISFLQEIKSEVQKIILNSLQLSKKVKQLIIDINKDNSESIRLTDDWMSIQNILGHEDCNNFRKSEFKYFSFVNNSGSSFLNTIGDAFGLKEKIKIFTRETELIEHDFLYFFKDYSDMLIGLNLTDKSLTMRDVKLSNQPVGGVCMLQLNKDHLFIHGGHCGNKYLSDSFLLETKTMNYVKIPGGLPMSNSRPVLHDNKIFIFGGLSTQYYFFNENISESRFFDLNSKSWTSITNVPIAIKDTSSIVLKNELLITGNPRYIYMYNPGNNNYKLISDKICFDFINLLVKYKEEIYLISDKIYESCYENIGVWTVKNSNTVNKKNIITAAIQKGKLFYFADIKGGVFEFDCELKEVRRIDSIV